MVDGYLGEIDMHTSNIQAAIEKLESKLAEGKKDEGSIKPLFDDLTKVLEQYTQGIRSVKNAYVSCPN